MLAWTLRPTTKRVVYAQRSRQSAPTPHHRLPETSTPGPTHVNKLPEGSFVILFQKLTVVGTDSTPTGAQLTRRAAKTSKQRFHWSERRDDVTWERLVSFMVVGFLCFHFNKRVLWIKLKDHAHINILHNIYISPNQQQWIITVLNRYIYCVTC